MERSACHTACQDSTSGSASERSTGVVLAAQDVKRVCCLLARVNKEVVLLQELEGFIQVFLRNVLHDASLQSQTHLG